MINRILFFPPKAVKHVWKLGILSQQKEEGKVQGQLNHTDSSQYIRDLKDQIAELQHEVRLLKTSYMFTSVTLPFFFFFVVGVIALIKISQQSLRYGFTLTWTD